jgi:hypothetical protein
MKSGSECFWMIADYEKYNGAYTKLSIWDALAAGLPAHGKPLIEQLKQMAQRVHHASVEEDLEPSPGRWFNASIARTSEMLEDAGYKVIDPDVGTNLRDPIIHFRKI